jgi:chromate transporter
VNTNNETEAYPRSRGSVPKARFLADVFSCSLAAYGGPESHFGVFLRRMVVRRKYLTEEELIELLGLCSMLPGPTSTQTIVSVGYKAGGPTMALLTMLVWALPGLILMTAAAFAYTWLETKGLANNGLRYIGPLAVGFIFVAAVRIGRKVVKDILTGILLLVGAGVTFFFRAPWIFPVLLVAGGAASSVVNRETGMWNKAVIKPQWGYLTAFAVLAIGGVITAAVIDNRIVKLFESFYRYGYLVFGGGQVVVPVMHSELVEVRGYMTNQEFLTGYGLVQGLPGPMFSFAAYAGGMAARGSSTGIQLLGSLAGGIGIFLPGLLLIYFVYPLWDDLKRIRAIQISIKGINAVAGGLIAISAVLLMIAAGITIENIAVTVVTAGLLYFTKIPAPVLVAAALAAGILI